MIYFADLFPVNVILVLGSERLHSDMLRRFSGYRTSNNEAVTITRLDKSGGCVDRDDEFMRKSQEIAIREYFFGDLKRTLSPHTQQVSFDEAVIYKIREGKFTTSCDISELMKTADSMLSHFLPGGEPEKDGALYERVEPSSLMLHCILAVMYASIHDSQDTIRDATVMGFVYVAEVAESKKRFKILAPLNTRFTDRPMILGSWPEATLSLIG